MSFVQIIGALMGIKNAISAYQYETGKHNYNPQRHIPSLPTGIDFESIKNQVYANPPKPVPTEHENSTKIEMDDREIEHMLSFFKQKFPKATQNNYPLKSMAFKRFDKKFSTHNERNNALQECLQQFANEVCDFLILQKKIKILVMQYNLGNVPGKFVSIDDFQHIEISKSEEYVIDQLFAFICRELCRYFLFKKNGVSHVDEKTDELLTEICAVYAGLGFYLYQGYYEFKSTQYSPSSETRTTEIGYITRSTIRRAIIQTVKIRKQQPLIVIDMFPTLSERTYAENALAKEIEAYKAFKKKRSSEDDNT